jgi:hypothetical protein
MSRHLSRLAKLEARLAPQLAERKAAKLEAECEAWLELAPTGPPLPTPAKPGDWRAAARREGYDPDALLAACVRVYRRRPDLLAKIEARFPSPPEDEDTPG